MRGRMYRSLSLAVIVVSLFCSRVMLAQELYNAPTEGIQLPSPSVTEVNNATAISTNPANIGFLDSWSFVYAATTMGDHSHLPGQGHGFYFAFPAGPLGFGVATELLLPHEYIRDWQGLDKRGRLSLAMSLNPSRGLGLGIAYRRSMRNDFGPVMHSLDLSIAVRPINQLNVAFTYSDANTPGVTYSSIFYENNRLPARHEDAPKRFVSAMTVRPFGDDRVALGAELHYMHGDRRVFDTINNNYVTDSFKRTDLHAMATVMLTDGVSLRGRFVAEGLHNGEMENGYYLDASLSIDSDRFPFGLQVSPYYKLYPEAHDGFEGLSMAVQFSGDVPPSIPLVLAPALIVPFEISRDLESLDMTRLISRLERARRDRSVDMLLLKPRAQSLSITQAMEVRAEVIAANNAGKRTVCYIEEADASAYLSCSAASEIWVNPAGGIRLAGLSAQTMYFKDLLDKIGVKADIVRIGQYKSAPEAFTETGPTPPADEAMNRFMDSVYGKLVWALQKDRDFKSVADTQKAIESGPFLASEALTYRIADKVVAADELESAFETLLGTPVYVSENYGRKQLRSRTYLDSPSVAVLHIEGDIVDGESMHLPMFGIHQSGAKTLTEQIRALKEDNRIRAVVLRINSPGGSALASDLVWREVMALRQVKPVVASLGDVAASGAYYIASAANVIVAESTTLTGSIGIYYGKADISGLLDKVGISTKTYARGTHADLQSWTRSYTDEERKKLMSQIRKFYRLFISRVSEGRGDKLTTTQVDKLGRGRIWSGADARNHKLVDRTGGYQVALDHARALGNIRPDTRVIHVPKPARDMLTLMARRMGGVHVTEQNLLMLSSEVQETLKAALPFTMSNHAAPQARLPFAIIEAH